MASLYAYDAVSTHCEAVENKYGFYESAYGEGGKAYTQLLPYSYYSIPYYHLNETIDNAIGNAKNPGEVPCSDHTKKSLYEFQMRVPQMCNVVCRIVLINASAKEFKEKIDDAKEAKYFINNHLTFTVQYHKDIQTDYARIVGFEVNAFCGWKLVGYTVESQANIKL
ncbi:transmembrane 9 superfamily member 8-like protein [Tanacetum coccineum]